MANFRGRDDKESGSGRDNRVQEATDKGAIEWRFLLLGRELLTAGF